jgi:hypothetical protein
MLKRPITFTDFEGQKITEDFYFNISRAELIEMEVSEVDGMKATIEKIIAAQDMKSLIQEFKKIILDSYGVKSEDGRRFIKSEENRLAFSQSVMFDTLFMELATNESSAANFIMGVLPADMAAELAGKAPQDKPQGLPPMPPTPKKPLTAI